MIGGLSLLSIAIAAQVHVNYHDQDFTLSDFDSFTATFENQGVTFQGAGKPLSIKSQASGLTLTGASANGTAQRGPTQAYFLKDTAVTGNANMTISGAEAHQYAVDQAKAAGKAPPPAQPEADTTTLQSETIHYTGDAANGRADFPTAVTIDSNGVGTRAGKTATTNFTRVIHITGSSGFLTLAINPGPKKNGLRTGELKGPVHFTVHNEDRTGTQPAEVTTLDGKADLMDFDFTASPPTLTLTGNVTMTGQGPAANGDITADKMVVTLDENLKPVKVDVTGNPAKTTLHQEPGK